MRRWIALAFGMLVASGVVAAAELAQRSREQGAFVLVPDLGYAAPEGGGGPGWREDEEPPPRVAGVRRVVCVGDSVTAGVGVAPANAWPGRVERLLGDAGTEVWNFGMAGWDARQVATLLETRIAAWKPDLVVWGTYANDIFRTRLVVAGTSGDQVYVSEEVPEGARLLPDVLARPLLHRSALFRRAQAVWYARRFDEIQEAEGPDVWYPREVKRAEAWSKASGIPLLIVALPPHVIAGTCTDPRVCNPARNMWETLLAALEASGVPYVDAWEAWDGKGPFDLPNVVDPDHPNDEGHRLLAEWIAPHVAARLPPPGGGLEEGGPGALEAEIRVDDARRARREARLRARQEGHDVAGPVHPGGGKRQRGE